MPPKRKSVAGWYYISVIHNFWRMSKWIADCSKFPSENNCDILISGTDKEEVAKAAMDHAVGSHKHDREEPGLYEGIKNSLEERPA